MSSGFKAACFTLLITVSACSFANNYSLPTNDNSLIGKTQFALSAPNDTVTTIAKQYNIGFNAIKSANPELELGRGFETGTIVTIPNQHLLPNNTRSGIVINLPEMRMYYFPNDGKNEVSTYPIGIGKIGNTIPVKNTIITHKKENPVWIPTENIRKFNLEQGIVLPKVMEAGPENPLGHYAIYTGIATYLIHSTIFPESVGKRASFGCIRMYESDIEEFFHTISNKVPVYILNKPIKIGFSGDKLYMESHTPLEENKKDYDATIAGAVKQITDLTKNKDFLIDWQLVSYLNKDKDGMPHEIGFEIKN